MSCQETGGDVELTITPNSQDSPFGSLTILPKEIREMIYATVFAAGSVALTRVSKAFHEDTRRALEHHGVYRVLIEFEATWSNWDDEDDDSVSYHWQTEIEKPFPYDFVAKTQNLQITILPMSEYPSGVRPEYSSRSIIGKDFTSVLAPLARSVINCRHCHIRLEKYLMSAQLGFEESTIDNKEFLDGLQTITVEWRDAEWTRQPWTLQKNLACDIMTSFLGFEPGCFVKDLRYTLIQKSAKDYLFDE